ncbi:GNAT family N-acetyltransferase [Taklimakanibacter lacteus]|uniref:GNAT family N-acetyltransferase n=1 Tax=Taklimakanibacter lacteus TaxID=2268456 RepID=UPI000E667813
MTVTNPTYVIRRAVAADEPAIQALVRSERLNPHHLYFRNFVVAVAGNDLIGACQIRRHRDGSRELGSVVVARPWRGRGLSVKLIDRLLADEPSVIHAITRKRHADHYARWGFEPVPSHAAPSAIRRNYRIGSCIGSLMAVLQRRRINWLTILRRPQRPSLAEETRAVA